MQAIKTKHNILEPGGFATARSSNILWNTWITFIIFYIEYFLYQIFSLATIGWIVEPHVAIFISAVLKKTGNLTLFNKPPLWGSKDVHSQNQGPYTYQKFVLHNWKRIKDKPKVDFYACSNLPEWKPARLSSECLTIILCIPYGVRFGGWIPKDRIAT